MKPDLPTALSVTALFAAISSGLTGCAGIAESSASSASVSSISASSAGVLATSSDYQDDIRVATSVAIAAAASDDDLLRQIAMIASEHGMADWEAERSTLIAIGEGFREAGLDRESALGRAVRLAGIDRASIILAGYRA